MSKDDLDKMEEFLENINVQLGRIENGQKRRKDKAYELPISSIRSSVGLIRAKINNEHRILNALWKAEKLELKELRKLF